VTGEASVELRLLEQKAAASQNIYEDFLRRLKETQEQEAVIRANARIVAKATVPQQPSGTGLSTFLLLGFVGSSVLGCGLAYLRDRTDRRIRTSLDVVNSLDAPCLSLVPFVKASKRDNLKLHDYIKNKPLSIYAEAVRSAHTQLRLNNGVEATQVIQITSTFPQEGKTTLAASLATSLVIDGFSTLLIDLDLRHPSVGREMDITEANCLLSYLYGEVPLDQLVLKSSSRRGCDIIAVKKRSKAPSRALASKRLTHLLEVMRTRYDRIIIDGTPSLGLSDAKMTLCHADATLFVVHWDKTSTDDAKNALNELRGCHAKLCGIVVTQVELGRYSRYGYGGIGGYYNKYGQYYED
jgi:capsular exopolysaccharide synthesis family protein